MLDRARARLIEGDLARAETDLRRVLATSPGHAEALLLLGVTLTRRGAAAEAARVLTQAVARAPHDPMPREHLVEALRRSGALVEAEAQCHAVLERDPGRATTLNLLGLVRLDAGDAAGAAEIFADAIRSNPRFADAMINLGVALNRTGRYEQAIAILERVLRTSPSHPLALTNLGMALKGLRRLDAAANAFERAAGFAPARFNLGFVHLLRNDLARGLPLLEARKELLGIGAGLPAPEWEGESSPDEALLVIPEQGLGDTLMMCRFLPELAARFRRVTAVVAPPLVRLIARAFPNLDVRSEVGDAEYDVWCSTMSLPFRLGIDAVERIPRRPWLSGTMLGLGDRAADHGNGPPRIGINWAGNPAYAYDAIRSTTLDTLRPLLEVPGVEWVSLHKGAREPEAEAAGLAQPLREARDFLDTAEVVAGLDLVISTETAIPNLSAAMGVPTCVLASTDPDWRWGAWYAGVTLCAQETTGDWSAAVARALEVVHALRGVPAEARAVESRRRD